jgi:citrate synthase
MNSTVHARGLEGVVAAESSICRIDGQEGKLRYMGYSIRDLVAHCSFEEVAYLLLNGELPDSSSLSAFSDRMRRSRYLMPSIRDMIRAFPRDNHPMELLQSAVAYLSGYVQHRIHHSSTCDCRDTLHQVAQMASLVAVYDRYRNGRPYVEPRMDLSHGGNFLYMLHGDEPDPLHDEIMDKCLILHAEHGLNASTFTSRVVASTMSTCYCSISAAMGALFGSLHGGANERVVAMVEEIGDASRAEAWVNDALDRKQKVMGMGHRVYKARDPRAVQMEEYLLKLSRKHDDFCHYEILKEIERVFRQRMEEKGKPIYPNVDFFSGAVYLMLGIPKDLFTPIFAMARVAGWLSHILEQREDNRIYRPSSLYIGHQQRNFVPIGERT